MTRTSYVLKNARDEAVLASDSLTRAREMQAERAKRNVKLRLVEQTIVEREI